MTTEPDQTGHSSASRAHRLLSIILALAVLAGVGWGANSLLRQQSMWMQPSTMTDFAGPWRNDWIHGTTGAFRKDDRGLLSFQGGPAVLIHRQRMQVPVAIEYEASITEGGTPGDLSVAWVEGADVLGDPASFLSGTGSRSIRLQVGAFDNTRSGIYEWPGNRALAVSPFRLSIGQRYQIRAELLEDSVSLRVDGIEILRTTLDLPLTSGHLGLFGFHAGKLFHRATVSSARAPGRVSPLVGGDALFLNRHFADAAGQYARIAESHAGSDLAEQARFRQGLAERFDGRAAEASRTWSTLSDARLRRRAGILELDELIASGSVAEAGVRFIELWDGADADLRQLMIQRWSAWITASSEREPPSTDTIQSLLWLRGKRFAEDHLSGEPASLALLRLGRYEEIVASYSAFERPRAQALLALGRGNEVVEADWAAGYSRMFAMWQTGLIRDIASDPFASPQMQALALCKQGQAAQALERHGSHPALLHLGRTEEMLAVRPLAPSIASETLIVAGRLEEAAGAGSPAHPGSGRHPVALQLLGRYAEAEEILGRPVHGLRLLQALEQGDEAAIEHALEVLTQISTPLDHRTVNSGAWFSRCFLLPWARHRNDRERSDYIATLRRIAATYRWTAAQRPGVLAAVVVSDRPVTDLASLPFTSEAEALSALAEGLKAEAAGDKDGAAAAYQRFSALPLHHRLLHENLPNPEIERFVAWRQRVLAGP